MWSPLLAKCTSEVREEGRLEEMMQGEEGGWRGDPETGQEPLWGKAGTPSGQQHPPPTPHSLFSTSRSLTFLDFHRSLTAVIILTSQMVNIATLFSLTYFSTMLGHNLVDVF